MKQLRGGDVSIHLGTFLSLCLFSFWGLWSGFLWRVDKEDKIRAFLFALFKLAFAAVRKSLFASTQLPLF